MAFAIPTLGEIVTRIKGDINSRMGNSNALIPRTLAWCLAYALAGVVWGLYLYQAYIARQVTPDTAEADTLLRWGAVWIGAKVPASKAAGTLSVYAVNGSTLDDGAVWQRSDGVRYITTGGPYAWASTTSQDVTVEAELAGEDGDFEYSADAVLELVSPPAGVRAENPLKASTDISGGADEESDESYLERIIERIQNPPQGGSVADYKAWAQVALATVDRVWVYGWPDVPAGEVTVFFTTTGAGADVIPTSGPAPSEVATVQAAIDLVRPVDAKAVTVAAPTPNVITIALTIHRESGATVDEADIARELEAMFRERAEVRAAGFTLQHSYIQEALSATPGIDWYEVTSVDGGAGTDDITLAADEYPTIVAGGVTLTVVP